MIPRWWFRRIPRSLPPFLPTLLSPLCPSLSVCLPAAFLYEWRNFQISVPPPRSLVPTGRIKESFTVAMLSHRVRAQTPQIHLHTRGDAHEIQIYFKLCYKREAGAADQPRVRARAERTLCNGVVQEQGYKKWEKALSDKHEAKFTRISDDTDVSLLYHTYFFIFFFLANHLRRYCSCRARVVLKLQLSTTTSNRIKIILRYRIRAVYLLKPATAACRTEVCYNNIQNCYHNLHISHSWKQVPFFCHMHF